MRGRKLIHSPDSAWDAFFGGFSKVAFGAGIPLTIAILVQVRSWTDLGVMTAIVLAFAGGAGVLVGVACAAPVLLQNWAWRKIAKDTPVAEHDEGLGS
ncbi:hypothetical protein [Brevundimonas sp.]|uniref:hypothetical protein n=1 Tax=Brevundimonas sp. TaxID=1871086 RepID=UPI0027378CD2|nr:hypothetical protein [Brevundimonas sp.]MDP3800956.1 hypothetical protein [Brevundimonas sp.]